MPSVLESLAFLTGIATVGCTAAAALFSSLARSFSSRASALKAEGQSEASGETIAALERAADRTGHVASLCTAAAAGFGCILFWASSNVAEMKEEGRNRFETESKTKIKASEEGTAKALAGVAIAKENTSRLEVEAARLREQATAAEAKIKSAEARAAEANERSARAGEGTAKALVEVAIAKENTSRLEIDAANLRERAARAEKELVEVQGQIQPRRLTLEQQTRLLRIFEGIPKGAIVVDTVLGDGEALLFGGQIRDILKVSGWGDVHLTRSMYTGNPIGLSILYGGKQTIALPLADAFASVGIKAKLSRVPQAPEDAVKILIGMKPYP